jgi:hypothetical protein
MRAMRPDEPGMILAVDPGGVTGIAWAIETPAGWQVDGGEVPGGRFGFYDFFDHAVEAGRNIKAIVCEDFIVTAATAKKTQQPDAMRVIGYLEAWARKHGVRLKLQTPSQAKSFSTNAKLKHFGWYQSSTGGHRNDAMRHLLRYLAIEVQDPATHAKLKEFE